MLKHKSSRLAVLIINKQDVYRRRSRYYKYDRDVILISEIYEVNVKQKSE